MTFKHTPSQARAEWVKALRSGDFQQTDGTLQSQNGAKCCLGVACSVFQKLEGIGEWVGIYAFQIPGNEPTHGDLPPEVRRWLGLYTHDGHLSEPINDHETLIGLNDDAGWDFSQIADAIETGKVKTYDADPD